ncbi:hypothetical protein EB001_01825 [bacterium]|nr:hypothetical protein [bacterium]
MSIARPQGSGSEKRNGGTLINAGNVSANGPIANVLDLVEVNGGRHSYGSKVYIDNSNSGGSLNADPHGVAKAYSAGTFAYNPAAGSNFIMRLAGDTNAGKISNVSSTALQVGGNKTPVSIHALTSTRRAGSYSDRVFNLYAVPNGYVFPNLTRGTGAGNLSSYVQADDGVTTTNVDNAAFPTRSVPGEFTYMFGGKSPKNDAYKAKNSYEA